MRLEPSSPQPAAIAALSPRSDLAAPARAAGASPLAIEQWVLRIYRRVRRLLWVRAFSWTLLWLLLFCAAMIIIDWTFRPRSMLFRSLLSGGLVAGIGAIFAGSWYFFFRTPVTPALVARRLESLLPGMGDRVSSAVAMTAVVRPLSELESEALRRTGADFAVARPERMVHSGASWITAFGALLGLSLAIAAVLWQPAVVSRGTSRLLIPGGENLWPQEVHLVFEELPRRTYQGDPLQWFIRNRDGNLPADTSVWTRSQDPRGEERIERLPIEIAGGQGVVRLDDPRADFSVRAEGGDDDSMPWIDVQVTAGPRIESFQLEIDHPSYTGKPRMTVADNRVRLLQGSTVRIVAQLTQPLEQATWVFEGASAAGAAIGTGGEQATRQGEDRARVVAAIREQDGRRFVAGPVEMRERGTWRFHWVDREGIASRSDEQWSIEIDEDAAPVVRWIVPAKDLQISPQGTILLERQCEDDLGLVAAWYELRVMDRAGEDPRLLDRVEFTDRRVEERSTYRSRIDQWLGDSQAAGQGWPLGTILEITPVALDGKGQIGRGPSRSLEVVAGEKIQQRIDQFAEEATTRLEEARRDQRVALEQTQLADARRNPDGGASAQTEQALRAAAVAQDSVARALDAEDSTSALAPLASAAALAEDNQVSSTDLRALQSRLEQLADVQVRESDARLDETQSRFSGGEPGAAQESLRAAIDAQQKSLAELTELTQSLQQGDAWRQVAEQLDDLAGAQQRLLLETTQAPEAGKQAEEQKRLSARQRELSRELRGITSQLSQLASTLPDSDPQLARRAEAALEILDGAPAAVPSESPRGSSVQQMREAAEELEQGRWGRARASQSQAAAQIDQARQRLRGLDRPGRASQESTAENPSSLRERLEELVEAQSKLVADAQQTLDAPWGTRQREMVLRTRATKEAGDLPMGFSESLEDAAQEMELAANLATGGSDSARAQDAAATGLRHLQMMADAMQPNPAAEPPDQPSREESEGAAEEPAEEGIAERISPQSLRLARARQQLLREQTAQLERDAAAANEPAAESLPPTPARARLQPMQRRVAAQQQELAERLARALENASAEPTEENEVPENQPAQRPPEGLEGLLEGLDLAPLAPQESGESSKRSSPSDIGTDAAMAPLREAIDSMEQAGGRIARGDFGQQAQEPQEHALDLLDQLLAAAEAAEGNREETGSEDASARSSQDQPQQELPGEKTPSEIARGDAEQREPQGDQGGRAEAAPGEGPGSQGAMAAAVPRLPLDARGEAIWGHLPEQQRGTLAAEAPTEYLPRYSKAISEYFKALAELADDER